ncbi:hypothetical protein [Synoicihabitans lomoniglobus]|uniref:DUF4019 domain-containing protein n=1 Tax=Synoicihabitans lomoniglobus TaxID=2909285 RepID=A0AAE9ZX08_9BACT|nr:hypothetical protein [Opitutaceae bacterium LMO-M01]WED65006.1 hypothetical protein PXH66_21875 [Opitutaceae bacterium LMO-M01]
MKLKTIILILVSSVCTVSSSAQLGMHPFLGELDRIKQAVNDGDSESVYKLSSMWFREAVSFSQFDEDFRAADRQIEELVPLHSTIGPDLATVVVKMKYREKGRGLISGFAVIYFDYELDSWKFNTIPFSRSLNALCSARLPAPLKMGFYNYEKKS